jgi:hypothetical protein
MNHNKINERQLVTIPDTVTIIENGTYYSVSLHWRQKLKRHKCVNQCGGPNGQLLVSADELPTLQKKYTEQCKLQDRYNKRHAF